MSVPIRRFVNVNVAFADFIDGESVGNESIDTSGNLYEWQGPALGWVQTRSGGAALVSDAALAFRKDDTTTAGYTYMGEAAPGTATSAAAWRVSRLNQSTSTIEYADGDGAFDNVWDGRASLSYS